MNFFASAIYNYWRGNKETKLYIHQHCLYSMKKYCYSPNGNKIKRKYNRIKLEAEIGQYFKDFADLDNVEKKLIELSKEEILDLGGNTGYYMRDLNKNDNVIGIDISKEMIRIVT